MKNIFIILIIVALAGAGYYFREPLVTTVENKIDEFTVNKQGQDAIQRNDWTKALVLYEVAHEKHPDNTNIAYQLARVYHRQSQKYEKTGGISYTREDKEPPLKLEKSIKQLQRETESLYRKVILANSQHIDAQIDLGNLLKETPNRYMEAVSVYREALKASPENPRLLKALGDLYKLAGDKRNPEDFSKKNTALRNWLYQWAVYYYRLSLKSNPDQYVPYFNLGVLYHLLETEDDDRRQQQLTNASRAYCNAQFIEPSKFELQYNLGLVLIDLGVVEEGFKTLSKAVNLLVEENRILDAQQLARQIQAIRNSVQSKDSAQFVTPEDIDGFLVQCLN